MPCRLPWFVPHAVLDVVIDDIVRLLLRKVIMLSPH